MENENTVARTGKWIGRLVKANENAAAEPGTWVRRLVRIVALVSMALVALFVVARVAWRFSGSNKWEFARDQNGVKVYTLKSPGSDLIQAKGVVRVRSTLGGLMTLITDTTICQDLGCYEPRIIERVDYWLEYGSFRVDLPFPFQTREIVIRRQIHQDPRTKEVLLTFAAAPDKVPPNDCCFRVTDINDTWRFTPLENGQVEIEYVQRMDEGGFIPDLLLNTQRPKAIVDVLSKLQELLNRKNYQDAKLDLIKEL
jgi:hypothetical protein